VVKPRNDRADQMLSRTASRWFGCKAGVPALAGQDW
jgi:hypothetical protein